MTDDKKQLDKTDLKSISGGIGGATPADIDRPGGGSDFPGELLSDVAGAAPTGTLVPESPGKKPFGSGKK